MLIKGKKIDYELKREFAMPLCIKDKVLMIVNKYFGLANDSIFNWYNFQIDLLHKEVN